MFIALGTALAFASGRDRVDTLPFSGSCGGRNPPQMARHLLGARAQVSVPSSWRTVHGLTENGVGTSCAQEYVVISPPGEVGRDCEQEQVYATATSADSGTPASYLGQGFPVIARGALPAVSGMRGVWEELEEGVSPKYAVYEIDAAYEADNHKLVYELGVGPPPSYTGICRGSGPQARAIARQIARSFRVVVTAPSTSQRFS
jgi:hypothetical protein